MGPLISETLQSAQDKLGEELVSFDLPKRSTHPQLHRARKTDQPALPKL